MKHTRKILFLFVGSALFLAMLQVIFATAFTTAGIDLSKLTYEKKAVEKENMLLGERLYQTSSFTTIAQKAMDEGFSESPKSRIVMSSQTTVAYLK